MKRENAAMRSKEKELNKWESKIVFREKAVEEKEKALEDKEQALAAKERRLLEWEEWLLKVERETSPPFIKASSHDDMLSN